MRQEEKAILVEKAIMEIKESKENINNYLITKVCEKYKVKESFVRLVMHWR